MTTYYSTFITGFAEVVEEQLKKQLPDIQIDLLTDGLVMYKTNANIETIKKISFFNNSFLLIQFFPDLKDDAIWTMAKQALKSPQIAPLMRNPLSGKRATFRIMAMQENQIAKLDNRMRTKLEQHIMQGRYLTLDRSKPEIEFLFSTRSEGFSLFGIRFTRRPNYEKTLAKGEFYPELATLLCLLSEPSATDVFLDPFSGSGAIPFARATFPFRVIYASDKDKTLVETMRQKARKRGLTIHIDQKDALQLKSLKNGSIDKIVTDPPWGIYKNETIEPERLYDAMFKEFARVLKKESLLVLLTAQKAIVHILLEKYTNEFALLKQYDTLVSGKKAGVFKIKRV